MCKFYINSVRAVRKIELWFLKIRYDPNYKFCRDNVMKDYQQYADGI